MKTIVWFMSIMLSLVGTDPQNSSFDYEAAWKKVAEFRDQGLPKSALTEVELILETAKREKNQVQIVRAVKTKAELTLETEENGTNTVIPWLEKEKSEMSEPATRIIASYLAELYDQYFQNNRYEISQRTNTSVSDSSDFKSWSSEDFYKKISGLYHFSIQGGELDGPVGDYRAILNLSENTDVKIRPTLYTILFDRYMLYLKENKSSVPLSVDGKYLMDSPNYLGTADLFLKVKPDTTKNEDPVFSIVTGYIKMLMYAKKTSLRALADYDFNRLAFMYEHTNLENKEKLYEESLQKMTSLYENDAYVTLVYHALAELYYKNKMYDKAILICKKAISLYPESPGANSCQNTLETIERPEIMLSVEKVYASKQAPAFALDYRNLSSVKIKIFKIKSETAVPEDGDNQSYYDRLKSGAVLTYEKNWELPEKTKYDQQFLEGVLPAMPLGKYLVEITEPSKKSDIPLVQYAVFYVSDVAFSLHRDDNNMAYRVVHRLSGKPIKNAEVSLFHIENRNRSRTVSRNLIQNKTTNDQGYAVFPISENQRVQAVIRFGKDVMDLNEDQYLYKNQGGENKFYFAEIFTDRSIYRPGQNVYFKALALSSDGQSSYEILKNATVDVILFDANYQQVAKQTLTTNDFGSVSGVFAIPAGGLMGQFSLNVQNKKGVSGQKTIRVEEYKRPDFEVLVDSFTKNYILNESVEVSGFVKNFAGNVVDGADITWKVVRGTRFIHFGWWRPSPAYYGEEQVIATGTGITDSKGKYSFSFSAVPAPEANAGDMPTFDYKIEISATDITGETQSAETSISLGYVGISIQHNLKENFDLIENSNIGFFVTNLSGVKQETTGEVMIEKLEEPASCVTQSYWNDDNRTFYVQEIKEKGGIISQKPVNRFDRWKVEKIIYKGSFTTAKPLDSKLINSSGVYKITSTARDVFGNEAKTITYHVVTDTGNNKYPKTKPLFVHVKQVVLEPGQSLEFDLGSSCGVVHAQVFIEKEGKILTTFNPSVKKTNHFSFPIEEKHRGGLFLVVNYVYQNRWYNENIRLDVPYTNKELQIHFESFREKISPASKEEYSLVISGSKKEAVMAEILMAMYDASLDGFENHQWRNSFYNNDYSQMYSLAFGFGIAGSTFLNYDWNQVEYKGGTSYEYPSLIGFQIYQYLYGPPVMYQRSYGLEERASKSSAPAEAAMEVMADAGSIGSVPGGIKKEEIKEEKPKLPPSVRKNLNEMVFFYPQMKTDENGNVKVSFTMNEALTRWKLMTFAHTQSMQTAYDERFVTTYKKVMVFPNAPRFVRTKDKITFNAKVVNTENTNLPATIRTTLTDVVSGKDVTADFLQASASTQVQLPANASALFEWEVVIPEDFTGSLSWTVWAETEGQSDGEENIIPVLNNQILVTETMPLYVHGNQNKTFEFKAFKENMSATKKDHAFTLEYSSHPVWYVIQSLPYLAEQSHECTDQIVNRYFANAVSSKIATSNPRIYAVFDRWRSVEKDALVSKLFSNAELKSALTEETPWVLQGLSEAEQKRNIALLFESNTLKNELSKTFKKLQERQMSGGGFPWFVNGREDLYVTQNVVEVLGQMIKTGALSSEDTQVNELVRKALAYIDAETREYYHKQKNISQSSKLPIPVHSLGIHYLYIRSFFPDIALPAENRELYDYYYQKAKEDWLKNNLYTQILIGIVLQRNDDKAAQKIFNSFEERSFYKEETGKYWNVGNGYRWDELPIERHSKMIEFYTAMKAQASVMDQMKLWLLKNKQTNHWPTTKSTVAAIYGLLNEGEGPGLISWVGENQPVRIFTGGETVNFDKTEAGTGYVKKVWKDSNIPKSLASVSINNPNKSTSWGSLYYQYFEDSDKIHPENGNPLKVYKQFFIIQETNKGQVLEESDGKNQLKKGDRLRVRLRVVSDRSMDYVHLKDSRPAGFEPVQSLSTHKYQGGLSYYENIKDLASHFYISHLPKGDFIIEYDLKVVHKGTYSAGLATIQSMYAPEFSGHSKGISIQVK